MSEVTNKDELIAVQKKERKDLLGITQKMKHSVPKGDKKKKKEVTAEIAQLLADLDLKHENQLKEFKEKESSCEASVESNFSEENESKKEDTVLELDTKDVSDYDFNKRKNVEEFNIDNDALKKNKAPRLSKVQKRRNKKSALEKERNKAIAEEELENLSGMRHIESENIKKKLAERNLAIYEIPSDGNCLYKAVEHQLSSKGLKVTTVESLRAQTAAYMLSHIDDYMPFLTHPITGDVLTKEQYEEYCDDIAKTPAWGGHIEIQVLSNVCGFPIEVIQAEGPSIITGNENVDPKLILSYHRHAFGLGEHYNSIVPENLDE